MPFVLDNSVAISWCFEDEDSAYADQILGLLGTDRAVVPAIWPLEVANAIRMAERRQRVAPEDADRFFVLLRRLPIVVEHADLDAALGPVLRLARAYRLTAYDAAYLELAIREQLPLASQDENLRAAARRAGVALVE